MQFKFASTNVKAPPKTRRAVERRLRFALTRFAPSIQAVSVALIDESGPHGAPAKKCRITVDTRDSGSVTVQSIDETFEVAASRAADRAWRSVARQLERRRDASRYHRRRASRQAGGEPSAA